MTVRHVCTGRNANVCCSTGGTVYCKCACRVLLLSKTVCGVVASSIVSLCLLGPARSMYADCLKRHIGKHWQQLAYHLGVNRTAIDSIVLKHKNGLEMQVNDFLETVQFPDLGPSTLALILVALRAAGLDCVEEEVLHEAVSRGRTFHPSFVVLSPLLYCM